MEKEGGEKGGHEKGKIRALAQSLLHRNFRQGDRGKQKKTKKPTRFMRRDAGAGG